MSFSHTCFYIAAFAVVASSPSAAQPAASHTNPRAHEYGERHERELWEAFQKAMHHRDLGDWMFYRPADRESPPNLGYFMGYRIVQAFYESYANKREALRAILSVTDYEWFLRESGYAPPP